jgi:hypothetical protein
MRRILIALAVLAVGAAAILIAGQQPFPASTFEFQQYREFRGTLITEPYPALAIPGQGLPWLLVAPGKHGVGDMRSLDGHEVKLTGERITRGDDHMIEIATTPLPYSPDSAPLPSASNSAPLPSRDRQGAVTHLQLTGEIVDSKCYFGVMTPGAGKVHRDCAVRCISGGIPPAFLVRDSTGNTVTLLLANWKPDLLHHIAEPVTIRGRLIRSSGRLILYQE